jgi:hypothetical protein
MPEQLLVPADNLDSAIKLYIPGLLEPGEFSFSFLYSRTLYAVLDGMLGLTNTWFKLLYPDGGSTHVVNVIVTKNEMQLTNETCMTVKTTCKCISRAIYTAGTMLSRLETKERKAEEAHNAKVKADAEKEKAAVEAVKK